MIEDSESSQHLIDFIDNLCEVVSDRDHSIAIVEGLVSIVVTGGFDRIVYFKAHIDWAAEIRHQDTVQSGQCAKDALILSQRCIESSFEVISLIEKIGYFAELGGYWAITAGLLRYLLNEAEDAVGRDFDIL